MSGCSQSEHPAATPSTPPPAASTAHPDPIPDSRGGPPLPPATALTDVMARLTDPAVPGDEKVTLIADGTAAEAGALDRFAAALRDNGSLPLTIEARDLAWSQSAPGNVIATVVIRSANPQTGEFTYPMEFVSADGVWQLTRGTADVLLTLDPAPSPPPPGPPPPPAPEAPR